MSISIIDDDFFAALLHNIRESLARDGEFDYKYVVDNDPNYTVEIIKIAILDSFGVPMPRHKLLASDKVYITIFDRFTLKVLASEIPHYVKLAWNHMALYIDGMHALRSQLIYFDPTQPPRTCLHCNKEFRGPAVYCCLAHAIADTSG